MACTACRRRSRGVFHRTADTGQSGNGGVTMSSAAASSANKGPHNRMKARKQDEVIAKHAPLVKRIAYLLMSRLPTSVPDLADRAPGPVDRVQNDSFKRSLSDAIASLPERERLVMTLYYDEELNLREIGAVIGVSESRVSQIHSQALIRLQARLGRWLDTDDA